MFSGTFSFATASPSFSYPFAVKALISAYSFSSSVSVGIKSSILKLPDSSLEPHILWKRPCFISLLSGSHQWECSSRLIAYIGTPNVGSHSGKIASMIFPVLENWNSCTSFDEASVCYITQLPIVWKSKIYFRIFNLFLSHRKNFEGIGSKIHYEIVGTSISIHFINCSDKYLKMLFSTLCK